MRIGQTVISRGPGQPRVLPVRPKPDFQTHLALGRGDVVNLVKSDMDAHVRAGRTVVDEPCAGGWLRLDVLGKQILVQSRRPVRVVGGVVRLKGLTCDDAQESHADGDRWTRHESVRRSASQPGSA